MRLRIILIFLLPVALRPYLAFGESHSQRAALGEFSNAIQALTARESESVVQMVVTGYGFTPGNEAGANTLVRQRASGSGVIVSRDGFIMTNAHVVDGARHIAVRVNAGSERPVELDAAVVGLDRVLDLALVKVE